jgi:hypothetical protein
MPTIPTLQGCHSCVAYGGFSACQIIHCVSSHGPLSIDVSLISSHLFKFPLPHPTRSNTHSINPQSQSCTPVPISVPCAPHPCCCGPPPLPPPPPIPAFCPSIAPEPDHDVRAQPCGVLVGICCPPGVPAMLSPPAAVAALLSRSQYISYPSIAVSISVIQGSAFVDEDPAPFPPPPRPLPLLLVFCPPVPAIEEAETESGVENGKLPEVAELLGKSEKFCCGGGDWLNWSGWGRGRLSPQRR